MIKVYTMETCPSCVQAHLTIGNHPDFEWVDIGTHVKKLKEFIRLRDQSPAFDTLKKEGYIGIPCFVLEDGRITFDADEALECAGDACMQVDGDRDECGCCGPDGC